MEIQMLYGSVISVPSVVNSYSAAAGAGLFLIRLATVSVGCAPTLIQCWIRSCFRFTSDGVVRHASFLGLRGDKEAGAVV